MYWPHMLYISVKSLFSQWLAFSVEVLCRWTEAALNNTCLAQLGAASPHQYFYFICFMLFSLKQYLHTLFVCILWMHLCIFVCMNASNVIHFINLFTPCSTFRFRNTVRNMVQRFVEHNNAEHST